MTGAQFDALTPRELHWRLQAYRLHRQQQRRADAQLALWVMNPWLERHLTVEDLIGSQPDLTAFTWQDE